MPHGWLNDGLHLLVQTSVEKGVDHYGILDVGNRIRHPQVGPFDQPIVIHQTPPAIRIDWLQNTGQWTHLGVITDEAMAIARIHEAGKNPEYDLFGNNCEHFARFVATGRRESRQVQTAAIVTGLVALAFLTLR